MGALTIDPVSSDITVSERTGGSGSATITAGGLTAGTDYILSVAKANDTSISSVTIANDRAITVSSTITLADASNFKIWATGRGTYYGVVESNEFTLTVN